MDVMLAAYGYVSIFSMIVAVVLAVAQGIPIIDVFRDHGTPGGYAASVVVCVPFTIAVCLYYWCGVKLPIALLWPIGLGYFWNCIVWRLRNTTP